MIHNTSRTYKYKRFVYIFKSFKKPFSVYEQRIQSWRERKRDTCWFFCCCCFLLSVTRSQSKKNLNMLKYNVSIRSTRPDPEQIRTKDPFVYVCSCVQVTILYNDTITTQSYPPLFIVVFCCWRTVVTSTYPSFDFDSSSAGDSHTSKAKHGTV
jgi:hypothetical protein